MDKKIMAEISLSEDIKFILTELNKYGESVICGGFIRDSLLGLKPKDVDFATELDYKTIINIFKDYDPKLIGEAFNVVQIKVNNIHYEIAQYRKETNHTGNRNEFDIDFNCTLEEDTKRRDYTICSLAYDGENIIDYNEGLKDLENKLIKFVGDPNERIFEDKLRMLRGIRFATKLNFEIEENTFKSIKKYAYTILEVSKERIQQELNKILVSENVVIGLKLLIETDLLQTIIPEFKQCINFDQNNPHHSKTLDGHILDVVGAVPDDLILRLSALFHDIGKPNVQTTDEKGISHYIGHEIESSNIATKWMLEYKYTNKQIKEVNDLISNHMRQHNGMKHKGIKRLINNIGEDSTKKLIDLFYADRVGKEGELIHIDNIKSTFENIINTQQPTSLKDLDINGNDLINLGFKDKKIGEMLNILLDKVMENPILNNKQKLTKIAKEYIEIKPTMIMMCGIPRSGKSSFIEKYKKDYILCSADRFRENLLGEKGNMTQESLVWKIHKQFYIEILNQRKNIIIDNTNIKRKYRKEYIDLAKSNGYKIIGIQIDTLLNVCLERCKLTNFSEEVLMRFFSNIQPLKYEEGFNEIKIIKGDENYEI